MKISRLILLAGVVAGLSACNTFDFFEEEETRLQGERVSILELEQKLKVDGKDEGDTSYEIPRAWRNEFWPQAGGYPNHAMQNLMMNEAPLQKVWEADIGQGSTKELPLTAQPIVVDGKVFTVDTESYLSAFDVNTGDLLWRVDAGNKFEDDPVIGGGVAYSRGQLYLTNGYSEIQARNPANGDLVWKASLPAPARSAPTVMNERIFVSTLDNRILSLSPEDGSVFWEYTGISESAGLVGAASPAVSRDVVIPAFSSGELFALRVENGTVAWAENLASFKPVGGLSAISDIRGLPVIDKGLVFAASFGGRLIAIDERTGTRIWERRIGSARTPWLSGERLFVLTTENELVSVDVKTGNVGWVRQLPRFEDPGDKEDPIFWTGPVMAANQLVLGSSSGDIVHMDPITGHVTHEWSMKRPVHLPLVIAGETLYILAEDGRLMAYR